jgi:hypothetical protein
MRRVKNARQMVRTVQKMQDCTVYVIISQATINESVVVFAFRVSEVYLNCTIDVVC